VFDEFGRWKQPGFSHWGKVKARVGSSLDEPFLKVIGKNMHRRNGD
jgi:hypothetical protein